MGVIFQESSKSVVEDEWTLLGAGAGEQGWAGDFLMEDFPMLCFYILIL